MKYLLAIIFFLSAANSFGQSNLFRKIESVKEKGIAFEKIQLFTWASSKVIAGKGTYQQLKTDNTVAENILTTSPYAVTLDIPVGNSRNVIVELIYESLSDYKVKLNNTTYTTEYIRPVHYRGIIKGSSLPSVVILTVSKTYITLFIADDAKTYSLIQKQQSAVNRDMIVYNSDEIDLPQSGGKCGLNKITNPEKPLPPEILLNTQQPVAASDKCIYGYLDCTNNLFVNRGSSVQNSIDYITAIYNDVATAYQNESINAKISEINIWQTTDPFLHTGRDTALYTFARYYRDDFYGNFAVMLESTGGDGISGLAGGIPATKSFLPNACGKFVDDPVNKYMGEFCVCDMNYFGEYSNYPVPANDEQVYLVTHEVGHLVDGRHTHDGGYVVSTSPTVYGSLDTCGYISHPTLGLSITNGTFMSYCIRGNQGMNMNFNAGFGTQPVNEIRAYVSGETCLDNCTSCVLNVTVTNLPGGYSRY